MIESKAERSAWRARGRLALGIVVSGASLVLLLWNIQWDRFWAALQGADYRWLVPSVATVGVAVWLRVLKWQLLLLPAGKVRRASLLHSIGVGYLVSTVLPGRLGELARVYLLARMERLSLAAVLSTVAVDRILDVVMVSVLLAVVLPAVDLPEWVGQSGLIAGAGGFGLLALCLVLSYPKWRDLALGWLDAAPRFPGKAVARSWAAALCTGVEGLRGAGPLARLVVVSAAVWLVTILTFYFAQVAFHIQVPLAAAALVLALTNLGMVVPSSPGYIGVYHYLAVLGLGAFGVEREVALGFAVVIHLVGVLPVSMLGTYSLWRCGITLTSWRDPATG